MKNLSILIIPALVLSISVISGCSSIIIKPAPIHEVSISIDESYPPQVFVYIKAGLADSCTSFHELSIERSGNTITINITTEKTKNESCAQVYGFFEKDINLNSDFISGEVYTV